MATTTQIQTSIPEYVEPYVKNQLARVESLTNINNNPYQPFTGQRIAGASPLQQQSYSRAQFMQPSAYTAQAGQMAGQVGQMAAGLGQYAPGQFDPMMTSTGMWSPQVMQQYMSPYQQGVTDIAKREAMRTSNIMGQGQNAQAVGAGAFGGSRNAIVQAERERNLGQQLNDIQMQGSNAAYNNAQQMFTSDMGRGLQSQIANQGAGLQAMGMGEQSRQFGANYGIAGLNTQLGAAGLLKDTGQSLYNQNIGIAGLQNQFGTQQQMTQQAGLDHNYQEFLNRQQWPFQQESFMNNIIRGLPQATDQTRITPSPSPLSQLAGIGTTLYGMSQLGKPVGAKKGGRVHNGGIMDVAVKRVTHKKKPPAKRTKYAAGGDVGGLANLLIAQIA